MFKTNKNNLKILSKKNKLLKKCTSNYTYNIHKSGLLQWIISSQKNVVFIKMLASVKGTQEAWALAIEEQETWKCIFKFCLVK